MSESKTSESRDGLSQQVYLWPNMRGQVRQLTGPSPEDVERQARETGLAKGYADGLEKGLAEGRRQAEQELATVRTGLDQLKASLESRTHGWDEQHAADVSSFLLDAFAALVGASARLTPAVFAGLIAEAQRAGSSSQTLRIEAHPDLATALHDRVGFAIEANSTLQPGEIVTETPGGRWSASLHEEFRKLLEQALGTTG